MAMPHAAASYRAWSFPQDACLVPVRQAPAPNVILRLCVLFALEVASLDFSGLIGEGLSLLCQLQIWAPYRRTRPTVQNGLVETLTWWWARWLSVWP